MPVRHRVGIIGANWTLKVHGSAWQRFPGVEVAAVCTAHRETAEAAAREFGIPKAYWNVEEMCADPDIDIVDVGSRPSFRYDMVMTALKAGKHVYNALPFALNLDAAQSQRDLDRKGGVVSVVDAQFRWVPAAQYMQKLVRDDFIGQPLGFNVQLLLPLRKPEGFLYPHAAYPEGGVSPYKWIADPASGGSGWRNFGTHSLLLLMPMLGRVQSACGTDVRGIDRWKLPDGTELDVGTADMGCGVLRMDSGAVGTIQTGWAVADGPGVRLEIWGTNGRLHYVDPSFGDGVSARLYAGSVEPYVHGERTGKWLEVPEEYFQVPGTEMTKGNAQPFVVSMGWMFHDMLDAIEKGRAGNPSFEEAAHAHAVVEAVIQSGQTGQWVEISRS